MAKHNDPASPAQAAAAPQTSPAVSLQMSAALRRVQRALSALRRGECVRVRATAGTDFLLCAGETLSPAQLRQASTAHAQGHLILSGARAQHLGLGKDAKAVAMGVEKLSYKGALSLIDPLASLDQAEALVLRHATLTQGHEGALALVKASGLLPAALVWNDPKTAGREDEWLGLCEADLGLYQDGHAGTVERVAEARVPLAVSEHTRVIAYRPGDGGKEHLAIVVGNPSPDRPVLVRLHSECFTGDLLGSLRCDCGEQLQGALKVIAEAGGGVLLYLAQEGRGIGLVNKLRAYRLQDFGADTLDANEYLGFEADERLYQPAAAMLKDLGFSRISLLTNNPDKISGLVNCGIEVLDAVQHSFPANGHNELYLRTKIERFGHRIGK